MCYFGPDAQVHRWQWHYVYFALAFQADASLMRSVGFMIAARINDILTSEFPESP